MARFFDERCEYPFEHAETLRRIYDETCRAENIGGTFSCESAYDLLNIARQASRAGITGRSAALLRYYAERIEPNNGAATKLDHAIAKALLALHDGAKPEDTLASIRAAIDEYYGVR